MGDLGNRLGDVVEYTFVPDAVMQKFAELGYEIETAARDYTITDAYRNSIAEVDILLQDGDTVILVEIKTKLTKAHIDEHVQRMQKMRDTKRFEGKALIGAAAGRSYPARRKPMPCSREWMCWNRPGRRYRLCPATARLCRRNGKRSAVAERPSFLRKLGIGVGYLAGLAEGQGGG